MAIHVDGGVILFGPQFARYDTGSGTCGTVDDSERGCRPLIGGDHADSAGVAGDGIIDGRGMNLIGEKCLVVGFNPAGQGRQQIAELRSPAGTESLQ